ncbi:AAEL011266-PA, partial [Aedes aegypti]
VEHHVDFLLPQHGSLLEEIALPAGEAQLHIITGRRNVQNPLAEFLQQGECIFVAPVGQHIDRCLQLDVHVLSDFVVHHVGRFHLQRDVHKFVEFGLLPDFDVVLLSAGVELLQLLYSILIASQLRFNDRQGFTAFLFREESQTLELGIQEDRYFVVVVQLQALLDLHLECFFNGLHVLVVSFLHPEVSLQLLLPQHHLGDCHVAFRHETTDRFLERS